jgi:carboxypeptidase C (cathepsin A)
VSADRSLFYFLVHSSATDVDDANVPVVVWLQGGNGCSSMIGAMTEHGPCRYVLVCSRAFGWLGG